ncbi:MAG: hypothetical protein K0R10_178 [Alphaproteobacteria bacterium]|jgi:uncharacterized membrane protein|nr:hypothetical protein [Alphaproteobacteria bacterium]
MTDPTIAPATTSSSEQLKLCQLLYGIFAGSMILQFINLTTILLGSAALTAGIILAYLERKKAKDPLYANHLQWLIRTFWIGGAVYVPVLSLILTGLLVFKMDMAAMAEAFSTGEGTMEIAIQKVLEANKPLIVTISLIVFAPFTVWWFWRCWYGWKRLKIGKTIPNAKSWI